MAQPIAEAALRKVRLERPTEVEVGVEIAGELQRLPAHVDAWTNGEVKPRA
jgi:hypothetical protein